MTLQHELGHWAEQQAFEDLEREGYREVCRNYHSRYGEIDLIVSRDNELVWIEVKARAFAAQVSAIESISVTKQRKLLKTALYFLQEYPHFYNYACRFDVICFDFQEKFPKKSPYHFAKLVYERQWLENAFTFDVEFITL